MELAAICRDCQTAFAGGGRCPSCRSPRVLAHTELATLAIAHVDADAFYASVEKADDPALRDRAVIVGGGRRGVVSTACYIARLSGVRSAMPMFEARRRCPEAVVVPPRMRRYVEVSRAIRAMMEALTPLVEPLSLDEAFLDLAGTERLHRAPPAVLLVRLQARIETELGVSVSIGLSHNKFLAKLASEAEKPRGFSVIGRAETLASLAPRPVAAIWGVGPAAAAALEAEGIRTFADLRRRDRKALVTRFGVLGDRLWRLARGEDDRRVSPDRPPKSVSNETTFEEDVSDLAALIPVLWRLAEEVSARLKAAGIAGSVVTLKLRRADHRLLTRRVKLAGPTQMAERLYRAALPMLQREMAGAAPFRLIGIGASELEPAMSDDAASDLLDPSDAKRLAAERVTDAIRNRFGPDSVRLGRASV
ncbi:DNA polymerase IV [Amaricoccus sp.]|uniref:DNA polymerase IV n=1 Tax=Amaricoccus sp. TaxID=1872485 RepID=UPI001B6276ED|nr:DNA polymerase IV [Amaricoccus sp.]MBP7240655.1 DNA polymerase IV [Amaricoccus sp.]